MHLIIGIDPGTTIGIAALDLNGNLIKLISIRNAGKSEIIRQILNLGTPSIISTDKKPCPHLVLKISSSFNVKVFVPDKELHQSEKNRIIKENNIKVENNHERDAFCAAYKTYYEFDNRLRQIEKLEYPDNKKDHLKHLILNGHSLKNAILLLDEPKKETKLQMKEKPTQKIKLMDNWIKKMREISNENTELKKLIDRLNIEKEQLELDIKKERNIKKIEIEKDKEVMRLNNTITRLKLYIQKLKYKKYKKPKKIPKKDKRKDLKILVENIITEYRDNRKKEIN